jgi:sulfide:quinone oxidoreductase
MSRRILGPTVEVVALRVQRPGEAPARVLVIGGGLAGRDALTALRGLAGDRVALELISDSPAGIDASSRTVTLSSGEVRPYDRLLLTVGALPEESIAGAVTFGAPGGAARFRRALRYAMTGEIRDLLFAVPAVTGLPLGVYELVLLTAQRLRDASVAPHLTLVTPERAPLIDFGPDTSTAVVEELEAHDIHVITGLMPEEIIWGELRMHPGKVRINADVVITQPRMRGPALSGLPCDEAGFIIVDQHGRVDGAADVYAAGDATTFFAIKDAGLAADQVLTAAESIAASVGVPLEPRRFRPVLGGKLACCGSGQRVDSGAAGTPIRTRQ